MSSIVFPAQLLISDYARLKDAWDGNGVSESVVISHENADSQAHVRLPFYRRLIRTAFGRTSA
jgi:hypothetical protein